MEQVIISGISTNDFIEKVAQRVAEIMQQKEETTNDKDQDGFITIKQAAEQLHLTPRTIRTHLRKGKIQFKRLGRRVLIKKSDLEKALK